MTSAHDSAVSMGYQLACADMTAMNASPKPMA